MAKNTDPKNKKRDFKDHMNRGKKPKRKTINVTFGDYMNKRDEDGEEVGVINKDNLTATLKYLDSIAVAITQSTSGYIGRTPEPEPEERRKGIAQMLYDTWDHADDEWQGQHRLIDLLAQGSRTPEEEEEVARLSYLRDVHKQRNDPPPARSYQALYDRVKSSTPSAAYKAGQAFGRALSPGDLVKTTDVHGNERKRRVQIIHTHGDGERIIEYDDGTSERETRPF